MGYDNRRNVSYSGIGTWVEIIRHQYPIAYDVQKDDNTIVFRRTTGNKILHLFLNIVIGMDLSAYFLFYAYKGMAIFYPIAIALLLLFLWRIILIFTFKMTIDKDKKALFFKEIKTKRYPLNSSLFFVKLNPSGNRYIGYYDRTALFSLKRGTSACDEMLAYLETINAEIDRSNF